MESEFDCDRLDELRESGPADADFELLMAYLDDELPPGDAGRLEARLRAEPELAAALQRMNAEHSIRQAVWDSIEPSRTDAEAVAGKVARAVWWSEHRLRASVMYRIVGGAAACIAIGFMAGWVGRGNTAAQATPEPEAMRSTVATNGHPAGTPAAVAKAGETPFVYQVALTDELGNITAVQKFDKLEDARNFAADVGRWQARQQAGEGQPVMTSSGL